MDGPKAATGHTVDALPTQIGTAAPLIGCTAMAPVGMVAVFRGRMAQPLPRVDDGDERLGHHGPRQPEAHRPRRGRDADLRDRITQPFKKAIRLPTLGIIAHTFMTV